MQGADLPVSEAHQGKSCASDAQASGSLTEQECSQTHLMRIAQGDSEALAVTLSGDGGTAGGKLQCAAPGNDGREQAEDEDQKSIIPEKK